MKSFQDIETAYPKGMSESDCENVAKQFGLLFDFEQELGNDKIAVFCKLTQFATFYCKVKTNGKTEIMYCYAYFNLEPKDIDLETFLINL